PKCLRVTQRHEPDRISRYEHAYGSLSHAHGYPCRVAAEPRRDQRSPVAERSDAPCRIHRRDRWGETRVRESRRRHRRPQAIHGGCPNRERRLERAEIDRIARYQDSGDLLDHHDMYAVADSVPRLSVDPRRSVAFGSNEPTRRDRDNRG